MKTAPESWGMIFQGLQLAVVLIAVITGIAMLGRRDAQIGFNQAAIGELKNISADLTKTTIRSSITDSHQNLQLEQLLTRIERLEASSG